MVLGRTVREAEFTAETVDKAVEQGLRTLGLSEDEVTITVVHKEQRKLGLFKSKAVVSIAYDEEYCLQKREEAKIEQYLTLRYAPDGFTLKIDPVPEELQPRLFQVATHFLIKHHVPGFKKATVEQLVEEQSGEFHLVFKPEVIELDGARTSIYLTANDMAVYYLQYDRATVGRETLDKAIAEKDVVKGILDEAIEAIATGAYAAGLPIVIAQGKPARNELAPPIEYQFNPNTIRITFKEDASVDFRDIMRLSFMKKDEVLVRKGERTPGEKGWTVAGKELNYKVEPDKPLPKGTNTYSSEDGKELRASKDGHIEMHDGLVCVEEVYVVEKDLDFHTGNVEFDGSVMIGGDVMPEFEIKAKGNVEVFGSVDDAVIETDGDVIVQYGIFAKGYGRVTAKGDVKGRHFENITVNARRIYVTSSAVNCQLNAQDIVEVTGSPGTLVGGVTIAGTYVFANQIGSELGTRTAIVVGDPAEFDARAEELLRLLGRKEHERQDLMKVYEKAAVSRDGIQGHEEKLGQMLRDMEAIDKELPELRAKLPEIEETRRRLSTAKCHVFTLLHDGTYVRLFTAKRHFTENVDHCTLLFDKDRVRPFPFQYHDLQDESATAKGPEPAGDAADEQLEAAGEQPETAEETPPPESAETPPPAEPESVETPRPAEPTTAGS